MKARVTRIDYESEDGQRAASMDRVDNGHVPPLGVTWYCVGQAVVRSMWNNTTCCDTIAPDLTQ